MPAGQSNPRVEVAAARLAVELKSLFATELKLAALELAKDSGPLTPEHYRQAVPKALSKVLQAGNTLPAPPSNVQRRVA